MGLLDLFKKNVQKPVVKSAQVNVQAKENAFLKADDHSLAYLRHAIWGDWFYSYNITLKPKPSGTFYNKERNRILGQANLNTCNCGACDEDTGELILPCHHMYRIALETGYLCELVADPTVESVIKGMRDPLFNALLASVIERGYYHIAKKWNGSIKTFNELQELNIIEGVPDAFRPTDYFKTHATAFILYSMTDLRYYNKRHGMPCIYNAQVQMLRYPK